MELHHPATITIPTRNQAESVHLDSYSPLKECPGGHGPAD